MSFAWKTAMAEPDPAAFPATPCRSSWLLGLTFAGAAGLASCAAGVPDAVAGRTEGLRMWREDGPVWIREVKALNLPVT